MHNSNGKHIPWPVAVSPENDRYGSLSEICVTLGASTAETACRTIDTVGLSSDDERLR